MRAVSTICLLFAACCAFSQSSFSVLEKPGDKKIEILFNGKLVTAYCYFDSTEKPVLFPVKTLSGVTVTRGYPVFPRPGERADHPHQVGLWLTYESVNGLDFWNNSFAIPQERKPAYGSIKFARVLEKSTQGNSAKLKTLSHWVDHNGKVLLEEITTFLFSAEEEDFIIDRTSSLRASQSDVVFKDVKDGLLGMRVARQLEMPSAQNDSFVNADRTIGPESRIDSNGVTGMYFNKEGVQGDSAWAKRSAWTYLTGTKDGKRISIGIIDHPSNIGYPTFWHARGYGLFAANLLGQKVFSDGKMELNFSLKKQQSVSFRHLIVVSEDKGFSAEKMNKFMVQFHKR